MENNYFTTECYYSSCSCHNKYEPLGYCDGNCEKHNSNLEEDKKAYEKTLGSTTE